MRIIPLSWWSIIASPVKAQYNATKVTPRSFRTFEIDVKASANTISGKEMEDPGKKHCFVRRKNVILESSPGTPDSMKKNF